jgi:hypothetical protein
LVAVRSFMGLPFLLAQFSHPAAARLTQLPYKRSSLTYQARILNRQAL